MSSVYSKLGKTEGKRRRVEGEVQRMRWGAEDERMRWLDSTDMNLSKLQDIVEDRGAWCVAVHGIRESGMTELLLNNSNNKAHF